MKFILFVLVMLSDATGSPPVLTTAEFNSEVSCLKAAEDLEATLAKMQSNLLATARCYEKGRG